MLTGLEPLTHVLAGLLQPLTRVLVRLLAGFAADLQVEAEWVSEETDCRAEGHHHSLEEDKTHHVHTHTRTASKQAPACRYTCQRMLLA